MSDFKKAKDASKGKKWERKGADLVLALICVALVVGFGASMLMEYIQMQEIGAEYVSVFWTNIRVRLIAQVLSFLIVFILFMANNIILRRIR